MSFALMQTVMDLTGLPLASKAVLLVLARHAWDDGTNPKCPSVQTIADKAGMKPRGARNALRALESDGWIEALGRKVGGRCLATNYRIIVGRLGPQTRHDMPPKRQETRHDVPPNGHDTRHDVPTYSAETRHLMPLNPAPNAAEYVIEEIHKEDLCGESESSACAHAHVREAPTDSGGVKSAQVIPIETARVVRPCDDGWTMLDAWRGWAEATELHAVEISARRWRSYWRERKGRCAAMSLQDLRDHWETWVLQDIERERKDAGGHSGSNHDVLRNGLAGAFGDCVDGGSASPGRSGGAAPRRIG